MEYRLGAGGEGSGREACPGVGDNRKKTLRWLEMQAFHLQGLSIFVALLEKSVMLSASWGLLHRNLGVYMCGNPAGQQLSSSSHSPAQLSL